MKIEIKTSVTVRNVFGVDWITVTITEEDLIELAKKKALERGFSEAECEEIDSVSTTP